MLIREAIGRRRLRMAAVLLLAMLAFPAAGVDDYFDLFAGLKAHSPPAASGSSTASFDTAEDDAPHCCRCSCTACVPMIGRSLSAMNAPDEATVAEPRAAGFSDSSFRPEVFRPPSV